jgi:hypothetical protein
LLGSKGARALTEGNMQRLKTRHLIVGLRFELERFEPLEL